MDTWCTTLPLLLLDLYTLHQKIIFPCLPIRLNSWLLPHVFLWPFQPDLLFLLLFIWQLVHSGGAWTIGGRFHFWNGFKGRDCMYILLCYEYLAPVVFALLSFFLDLLAGLSGGLVFYLDFLHLAFDLIEFFDKLEVIYFSFSGLLRSLWMLKQFSLIFRPFYWLRPRN